MKRTPLQRKTPLKATKQLQRKTPLKTTVTLKTTTPLKSATQLKRTSGLKVKQKTAKKLNKPYESIFTADMSVCYITGCKGAVPHHVFNRANKALSEKYGFILPLSPEMHELIHKDQTMWLKYKVKCEEYYIHELHRTKEQWIEEFGMWWSMENVA